MLLKDFIKKTTKQKAERYILGSCKYSVTVIKEIFQTKGITEMTINNKKIDKYLQN